MPVDPGNLMLVGSAQGHPVLGAPGCARSPKENGFDWILMRLLAGLPVSRADITGMGVGGLLMEIVTRPQPREEPLAGGGHRIAAVILAAGRSTRMGGANKLLEEIGGRPLVRIAAEQALKSKARPVIVVTGHQREKVEDDIARSRRQDRRIIPTMPKVFPPPCARDLRLCRRMSTARSCCWPTCRRSMPL